LRGADEPDDRRRVGERIHLHGQCNVGDEPAERAHELADEDEPEVAVPAQRRDI
jgi:hypothetical protein